MGAGTGNEGKPALWSLLAKRLLPDDCRMGGRSNDLQPLLLLHYLLGRNVPFRGLGFSHIGKGRLGTSSVSLALFPQGVIYGITWAVLAGWAGGREHRLHLAAFFFYFFYRSRSSVRGDFSSPVMFSALLFQKASKRAD